MCTIPRLPLVGGRYAVRAAVLDAASGVPLALPGRPAPVMLDVISEGGAAGNWKTANGQLFHIDAEWS